MPDDRSSLPAPVPGGGAPAATTSGVPDVRARLVGFEDLTPDLQVLTLQGIDADLRVALEAARS